MQSSLNLRRTRSQVGNARCLRAAAVAIMLGGVGRAMADGTTIWVEAELFDQKGGWVVDGQFIEQMGSSYLLAAGRCKPVDDAYTEVTIDRPGRYALWVRCKNWLVEFSPGRFRVKVGGQVSPAEFGKQSDAHWTWVKGGSFELSSGKHRVTLHDLTGSYGRCDALVLTSDAAFVPPDKPDELLRLRRRLTGIGSTVEDRGSFDVIVVGGGVAGCCAAISSARHGAKTVLIQDRPVLGGNASDEIRVWVQGATGGRLSNARETGLLEEMRERARGATVSTALADMARAEPRLTLCLLTRATKAVCNRQGHIDAVEAVHVVMGQRSTFKGKVFIDCTGDGVIGASAGAIYRVGREGKAEFNESIAPDTPDRRTLGTSLLWGIENAGEPVRFVAPPWVIRFASCKDLPHRRHDRPANGHWWFEFGGGAAPPALRDLAADPKQLDTIKDAEVIRDYVLRVLFGVWDHCKNHPAHKARYADYRMTWAGYVGGKRESRRLIGDYIMVEDDILAGRTFPDQVAYGGWSIDLHPPNGIHDPGPPSIHHFFSQPYGIPFRSLYSKNVDNLMFAGRNISVSHVALGTTRVMATCGVIGQGVGTAAALCVKHGVTPRQIGREHIRRLQQLLLKDDAYLVGLRNEDPADLARAAKVSASSMQEMETLREDVTGQIAHDMNCPRAEMFRVSKGHIKSIRMYVISSCKDPVTLRAGLREARRSEDFSQKEDMATASATVPGRHRGWVTFAFDCTVKPGGYYWVHVPPAKGLRLQLMREAPPGSRRAYGGRGQWHPSAGHYAFSLDPPISWRGVWAPSNVIDGVARPVGDDSHMWASDPREPLPQWIELDLGVPREIGEIRLTFDSNVNTRYLSDEPPAELVREYRVRCVDGDRWVDVLHERENASCHRVHRFEPVTTDKIRVEVLRTHGSKSARIFELRLYGPKAE